MTTGYIRALRGALYFVVGLLLGGVATWASAAGAIWAGADGMVIRSPSGVPVTISMADGVTTAAGTTAGSAVVSRAGAMSINGGAAVGVQLGRQFEAAALARMARPFARAVGPIGLAMTLAPLVWDEAQQLFEKEIPTYPAEWGNWKWNPSGYTPSCQAYSGVPTTAQAAACLQTYSGLQGWVFVTMMADTATQKTYRVKYTGPSTQSQSHGWYFQNDQFDVSYLKTIVCDAGMIYDQATGACVSQSATHVAATDQDVEDAIYAELVARGFGSELARRLIDAGYSPDTGTGIGASIASGPASVPGPSSTSSSTGPGGATSSSTSNTTYNLTYNQNQVQVTASTVTTKNDASGTTTETTTQAANQEQTAGQSPEESYSLTYQDATLPEIEGFYTPEYEDGLAGVWEQWKTQLGQTSLGTFISGVAAGAPTSGTCPSWQLSWDLGPIHKTGDISPPCWIWPILRTILLVSAFFVAHRLVFGG